MGRTRFPLRTGIISVRVVESTVKEVERIVRTEGYTNVGDYVRDLIRKDFKERGLSIKIEVEEEKEKVGES